MSVLGAVEFAMGMSVKEAEDTRRLRGFVRY